MEIYNLIKKLFSSFFTDTSELRTKANQGDVNAQISLGKLYFSGNVVKQDYHKAKEYYELAANQGNANAQVLLGIMYEEGKGVKQDYLKAKEYFGLSCDNGLQRGCDNYRKLNEKGL